MSRPRATRHWLDRPLDRRRFLRLASLAGASALLAGCRGDDTPTPSATPTPPPPTAEPEVLVTAVAGYDDPAIWAGRTLTVTSWGGDYQRAQERAIVEPFQRLTGAVVSVEPTDITQLRDQVEDEDVRWDVCDVLTDDVLVLANLGLIEEIDFNIVDSDGLFPDLRMDHGVGSSFYSTVLAYQRDAWPGQPPPASWVDFWNVDRFPGARGLHRQAQTTLEFALLADGVAIGELYPLDLPRAFAALDRVLPSITLLWEQGAQPPQIMSSGDLAMVAAWHSRMEAIREDGAPVEIVWNEGALAGDSWVIPRGSANRDLAMDFVNFATRPEVCAAFASLVPFGPVNRKAFDLLPREVAERLPSYPPNHDVQFLIDFEWWFSNREAVDQQFEDWLAEHP